MLLFRNGNKTLKQLLENGPSFVNTFLNQPFAFLNGEV